MRSRVVTFRLTESEYAFLKSACGEDQSSLSAIARKTLLAWAGAMLSPSRRDQRLDEIEYELSSLRKLLRQNHEE
jgi:hypothetical protein